MIETVLGLVASGQNLSIEQMADTINAVMQGQCSDEEIALLLTALRAKGETVDEIAGAALAMRRNMTRIESDRTDILDTCGPGGVSSETFNVSTTAAIVTAAAGVSVAKHGNRSVTSKTGSADVLAQLGVNIEASADTVGRCLNELGLCFCFAPMFHPAMKRVGPVRKKLGVRTIFNLLGPLCNPAGASFQLMGVGMPEWRPVLAEALAKLGTTRALVVTGEDGVADVTLSGETEVTEVDREVDGGGLQQFTWAPADFGLETAPLDSLQVAGPEQSAAMIRALLDGQPGPPRDMVILNAAAGLYTARRSDDVRECAKLAAEAIDSGAAAKLLAELAALSHR